MAKMKQNNNKNNTQKIMENTQNNKPLLQISNVLKLRATINKIYSFSNIISILFIFYYRLSFYYTIPFLPWLIMLTAEFSATFIWLLKQPISWWPVTRTVYVDRLPKDEDLPKIDVFICTADPKGEPTFDVMNTIISAMALNYPNEKLSVYLSDDYGANNNCNNDNVTLYGMKEAWIFATWWLPFVKKYNVKTICPKAFFEDFHKQVISNDLEFLEDIRVIKEKYEEFEQRVKRRMDTHDNVPSDVDNSPNNHPPFVKVVNDAVAKDITEPNPERIDMPLLVYIAREKRPSRPHNFKAGALNVLLRVSSTISNAPYILVLDCDMYCNGSSSARQAMCFHLDPSLSPTLGWVQYPHKFHNISESDIYDSQMRFTWPILYPGMDELGGPVLSGTNFYIKRQPLFSYGDEIKELKSLVGSSNVFVDSLSEINKVDSNTSREISTVSLQEAHSLASCTYEQDTKWGEKVGFRYKSVVEDVMTGFQLQSQGWKSVYINPTRPEFLGSATTNLNDLLTQGSRWAAGLLQIGLTKHNPLIVRPSKMGLFQKMLAGWVSLFPLDFIPILCFAIVPPICLFYGVPLFPQVFDPLFIPFAFTFITSNMKHLLDVIYISKGSINSWMNESRITLIKGVTCYIFGTLECIMSNMGIRQANFIPTNKAGEDDKTKWYRLGKFDFRAPDVLLIPLVTVVTLNMFCFIGGVIRTILMQNIDQMFAQVVFSIYVAVMSFPVIEGMLLRKDNGRVSGSVMLVSAFLSMGLLSLGYFTS